jgi:hypothetical protein
MISVDRLSERLLKAEYAVRGPIVQRAQELEAQGRKIIYCNIGNPQALRQRPLTYLRQLLCLLEYPELLERADACAQFPKDVQERARSVLREHPHGLGAYTQSPGIPFVRKAVADFIARRDGIPADPSRVLRRRACKGAQACSLTAPHGAGRLPGAGPAVPAVLREPDAYGGSRSASSCLEGEPLAAQRAALTVSLETPKRSGSNGGHRGLQPGNPTGGCSAATTWR